MADVDYNLMNATMSRISTLLEVINNRLTVNGSMTGVTQPGMAQGAVWQPGVQVASMFGDIPAAIAALAQPMLGGVAPISRGPSFSQHEFNRAAGFMSASMSAQHEADSHILGKLGLSEGMASSGANFLRTISMAIPEARQYMDMFQGMFFQKSGFTSQANNVMLQAAFASAPGATWQSAATEAAQARSVLGRQAGAANDKAFGWALSKLTGRPVGGMIDLVSSLSRDFQMDASTIYRFAESMPRGTNIQGTLASILARADRGMMGGGELSAMAMNLSQATGMTLPQSLQTASMSGEAAAYIKSRGITVSGAEAGILQGESVQMAAAGVGSRDGQTVMAMMATDPALATQVLSAMRRGDSATADRLMSRYRATNKGATLIGHIGMQNVAKSTAMTADAASVLGGYDATKLMSRVDPRINLAKASDQDIAALATGDYSTGVVGRLGLSGAALDHAHRAAVAEAQRRGLRDSANSVSENAIRIGKELSVPNTEAGKVEDSWDVIGTKIAMAFAKIFGKGGSGGGGAALDMIASFLSAGNAPATVTANGGGPR